ncbi:hypothetical protein [Lichenicoccus roseus]|uniref:Uncharacterized protein n=1 Tax=Lichenicoccus roseus TaxID=2683649 RepID=A0A5R9J4W3_9PROT|nr:hypothetical protein [Lichenicoccus roseus]TLU71547.1 hypothetical protein FE263_16865 [Lichenicoccus roseus]
MSNITVERDSAGISRICRRVTLAANLRGLVVFVIIALGMLIESLHALQAQSPATAVYLVLFGGSLLLVILFLLRFKRGDGPMLNIASRDGVTFFSYPELGVVPWATIESFDIEPSDMRGSGGAFLVATVRQPSSLQTRLKSTNSLAPGRRYAPPFPCVERAWITSLPELKADLDEFHAQYKQAAGQNRQLLP